MSEEKKIAEDESVEEKKAKDTSVDDDEEEEDSDEDDGKEPGFFGTIGAILGILLPFAVIGAIVVAIVQKCRMAF